jgi:TonB family protein
MHAALLAALVSLARTVPLSPAPRRPARPLTFFSIRVAPDPALLVKVEPVHLPRLIVETPKIEQPAPLPVAPLPERRIEAVARVEPSPAPPAPELHRELPKPIEPPKPAVRVGAFASGAPAAHAFEPPRPVERAGFDAPAARTPDIKIAETTKVGAFDQGGAPARPQAGSDRPNVVTDAGFGTAMSAPASRQAPRAVADAGFGGAAPEAPKTSAPRAVQSAGFDARPAPAAARAAREVPVETPLEILSKPTPEYTEEARKLKIEGDVVLDIEFCSTGEIRVKRVVRGLGHGLDEAATRAAQGMRFKPAQSNGRPVDFRTTVHILFRLA